MIGIKRLAEHLNISIGTVSRALNGRPDVNDETRKRVLEAAAELGYVAKNPVELAPADRQKVEAFLERIDDHDDVHRIYAALA